LVQAEASSREKEARVAERRIVTLEQARTADLGDREEEKRNAGIRMNSLGDNIGEARAEMRKALQKCDDFAALRETLLSESAARQSQERNLEMAVKEQEVKIEQVQQLETVIELIFKKALAEIHYSETYADLVYYLKPAMPTFTGEDGKKVDVKKSLLNACQQEFEDMERTNLEEELKQENRELDKEELEFMRKKKKGKMMALMKLIGHLFLRDLLSPKVIGNIIQDLACCEDASKEPEEHVVECICELPCLCDSCSAQSSLWSWIVSDFRSSTRPSRNVMLDCMP